MNVAQLKHLIAQRMGRDDAGFPRLNERGSIEAAPQPQGQLPPNWFPRLNERGSIEAPTTRPAPAGGAPVSTFE